MTRRARGEGTVVRDGDGWIALLWVDGRRRKRRGATQQDALDRLGELRTERDNGLPGSRSDYTVGDLLDDWLRHGQHSKRWEPSTLDGYTSIVDAHLRPQLGRVTLRRLTTQRVQRMLDEIAAGGRAPQTVKNIRDALRSALGLAMRQERVLRNVAGLADTPPANSPEVQPLSLDEAQRFLDALGGERLRSLYALAVGTGLRQSELIGLRWEDVDLDVRMLHVRRKTYRRRYGLHTGRPKSAKSQRTIPIPDALVSELQGHRLRQLEEQVASPVGWEDPGLLFANQRGGAVGGDYLRRRLAVVLARADLPSIHFHDLRHTAASMLHAMGCSMKEIQDTLGHADFSLTANTYTHLTAESRRGVADRMDAFFGGAGVLKIPD